MRQPASVSVASRRPWAPGGPGLLRLLQFLVLALLMTACAAPATTGAPAQAEPVQDAAVTAPRRAPPMSDPLPPMLVPGQDESTEQDSSDAQDAANRDAAIPTSPAPIGCTRNADCAIRNVGSCCGERPACVHVDTATDPEGVQAQCAKTGMVSTCGFPVVESCQCLQGACQAGAGAPLQ